MPTEAAHQTAADRHLQAAKAVVDQFCDWTAVMLFYSALHEIEAVCATHGQHFDGHKTRDEFLARNWAEVFRKYKRLKNESRKVRYLEGGLFSLTPEQVKKQLVDGVYAECVKLARDRRKQPMIPTSVQGA